MTGLRERQKADRTGRILAAASDLFRAQGYDAVRIEDIAAAAEVSAGASAARALGSLIHLYYDHSLHYLSKEMWRKAMAFSIEAPGTPFSQRYTELDAMLSAQVSALIAALQARGLARADLDPAILGQIVFNTLNQMFIEFVKADAMPLSDLHRASDAQTESLAALMQP